MCTNDAGEFKDYINIENISMVEDTLLSLGYDNCQDFYICEYDNDVSEIIFYNEDCKNEYLKMHV